MAKKSSASTIATLVLCVPLLIGAWFIAPLFLPVWAWLNLDFARLAQTTRVPQAELERVYQVQVRYQPRGEGDPYPWQIIAMDPPWGDVEGHADEDGLLVRCRLASDRTGEPPSQLLLGSLSYKDTYFRCRAWRLPSGALPALAARRPLLVYHANSLEKMDLGTAQQLVRDLADPRQYADDDGAVDDGYVPPEAAAP